MNGNSQRLRLLIFAHVPPPMHGQSLMVQQLVNGLVHVEGSGDILCKHVDARYSGDLGDVGRLQLSKLKRLMAYCREAAALQRSEGLDTLLMVPAPPDNRGALLRDWLQLGLLRRRFSKLVFYWQAAGLGTWLKNEADPVTRAVSLRVMSRPDLSIVLADSLREDSEVFRSKRTSVVPNFTPDPSLPVIDEVIRERQLRFEGVRSAMLRGNGGRKTVQLLFMSLCCESKGLFDTMDAVALLNRRDPNSPRFELRVAGKFPRAADEARFRARIAAPELQRAGSPLVQHVGFVGPREKEDLFRTADVFCFPTFYPAEAFPTVLVEAMAWDIPVVTTAWRGVPEILPRGYEYIVPPRSSKAVADCVLKVVSSPLGNVLRGRYLERFEASVGLGLLREALRGLAE